MSDHSRSKAPACMSLPNYSVEPTGTEQEETEHTQPAGNAAAQAQVCNAPSEHTIFVDGTWQDGQDGGNYWNDDVQSSANELLGADSDEEFGWYGGPNDPLARRMAGRKLLREGVEPAWARGDDVNLVGHSHGGNVIGEMGAALGDRQGYLGELHGGVRADSSDEDKRSAEAAIVERLEQIEADRAQLDSKPLEAEEVRVDNKHIPASTANMHQQLDDEEAELRAHYEQVITGEGADAIAQERTVLAEGHFNDVVALNTPWLNGEGQHPHPLDQESFVDQTDKFTAFNNDSDNVAGGAWKHDESKNGAWPASIPEGDYDNLSVNSMTEPLESKNRPFLRGAEHPKATEHTWNTLPGEGVSVFKNYVENQKQDHTLPVNDVDVFDRVVRGAME